MVSSSATPWTAAHQASLSVGFSSKNPGVDSHFLLQGIFPTQRWNPGLLHCRQSFYCLSHQRSPTKAQRPALDFSRDWDRMPLPLLISPLLYAAGSSI